MLAGVQTGATPIVPELPIMRTRGEGEQRATFFELFFDLVYVFAVTQLSHQILDDLTVAGVARAAFLLLVVWWAWIYTTWMANWFDPGSAAVRGVLTAVMRAHLPDLACVLTTAVRSGRPGIEGLLHAVPDLPAAVLRRRPIPAHVRTGLARLAGGAGPG